MGREAVGVGRPGWRALAAGGVMLAMAGLGGCADREALAQRVAADVDAVTAAQVTGFELAEPRFGTESVLEFALVPGEVVLSTEDLVAAIKVLDGHNREQRAMYREGWLHIVSGDNWISVSWSERSADSVPSWVEGAYNPYDDSYCQLPDLKVLDAAGRGSDFSHIALCNPELEALSINGWPETTGREGLAGLENLKELVILGPVDDIDEVPTPETLESLEIHLADDTPANRRALEERLPGCHILFQENERFPVFDPTADPPA